MESEVPKLRFQGFSSKWYMDKLSSGTYIKGRIGWKNLKKQEYTNEGPYLIAGKHIKNGLINWEICDHISIERYEESLEIALKENDIILSKDGTLGNPALIKNLPNKATINSTMMLLRLDLKKYYPEYFYYILHSKYFYTLINTIKSGSSVPHIFQRDMVNFKFPMTSLKEQEKIGNFFRNIDEIIGKQHKKINKLESLKKGLMKNIFKQEVRFKNHNGQEYPNWKEIKLSEFLVERKLIVEKDGNIPHVTLSKEGIFEKGKRYNRDFLVRNINKKYKVTLKNDICYNPANLKFGVICKNNFGKAIFSPIYVTFEILKHNISFISYIISRKDFINKLLKYEEGTLYERAAVKPEDFLKLKINLPSLEEQEKIADVLLNLDEIINRQYKKLKCYLSLKKALLQKILI